MIYVYKNSSPQIYICEDFFCPCLYEQGHSVDKILFAQMVQLLPYRPTKSVVDLYVGFTDFIHI